jgi:hypothetical protein
MAQSGFTPIQLYYSITNGNTPLAGNLAYGELALNSYNGTLYYKNYNTGLVSVLVDSTGLAKNITGGVANQLVYQTAPNTTNFITVPTSAGTVLGWTGSAFSWVAAPAAVTATSIAGGLQYQIPFQSAPSTTAFNSNLTFNSSTNTFGSSNITATSVLTGNSVVATTSVTGATIIANSSITASAAAGAISYGTLSYSDSNIFSSYKTSINSYAQKIIQNTNNGAVASVDFIVSNDVGTANTYYGDFGMNSSGFSGTGSFQAPNAVFLYSITADLVIGTKSSNYIRFVANDSSVDAITIAPSGAVSFNANYGTTGQILTSAGNSSPPTWVSPSITVAQAFITMATGSNQPPGGFNPSDSFALI